jgi:hypothetical protein
MHYLGAASRRNEVHDMLSGEFLKAVELTLQHVYSTLKVVKITGVKIDDRRA